MDELTTEIFYHRLNIQRQKWYFSWDWVAKQSGVSLDVIIGMAEGKQCSAEEYNNLLLWLYEYGG